MSISLCNFLLGLCLATSQSADGPPGPSAAEVVSQMLGNYSKATSLVGTVRFIQEAQGTRITVDTVLQFEKPSKFYLRQVNSKRESRLVVSDGEKFSYDAPKDATARREGERLYELINRNGVLLDIKGIYKAAARSLIDRSAALDIAISNYEDLKYLRNQWATLILLDKKVVDGKTTYVVGGDWREYPGTSVSGTFEIWIDESSSLKRYTIKEIVAIPDPNVPPIQLISTWEIDYKIGTKVEPNLFKVS